MSEWAFNSVLHDSSVVVDTFWSEIIRVNLDYFSSSFAPRLHSLCSAFAEQQSESAAQLFIVSKTMSALRPLSLIIWLSVANGNTPRPHYNSPASHSSHSNTYFALWTGGYPFCTSLINRTCIPAHLLTCADVFRQQLTAREEPDWSCGPTVRGGSKLFVERQVSVANMRKWLFYSVSILTASSSLTGLLKTILRSSYLLLVRRNIGYYS